jgi:predicted deacylase
MNVTRLTALALLAGGLGACAAPGTNPPGTAATRAADRAAGTNVSGAYPSQSDGTRANPSGTEATRALDRAAGTNTSGAYPTQSDGVPGNPPGTAAGRAVDRALDTSRPAATRPVPTR